jgi:hypothetical protein
MRTDERERLIKIRRTPDTPVLSLRARKAINPGRVSTSF